MRIIKPPGKRQMGHVGTLNSPGRTAVVVAVVLLVLAALIAGYPGGVTRASAVAVATADSPGSCNEVIDGISWNLDPCIPVNGPYPQDFANTLAAIQSCPTAPAQSAEAAVAQVAARNDALTQVGTSSSGSASTAPASLPATSAKPSTSAPTTAKPSTSAPTATATPTSTSSPYPCPTSSSPSPNPSYTATDSPTATATPCATGTESESPTATATACATGTSTPTDSASASGSASSTSSSSASASESASGTPSDSASGTGTASATDSASGTGTASATDSASDTASPSGEPTDTDCATDDDSDSPPDTDCATDTIDPSDPGTTTDGDQCGLPSESASDTDSTTADPPGADADLIQCRDPKTIPDPGNPVTLVAAGDSITSAHNQTGFGIGTCDNTTSDARKLTGNDANFSYAGLYFGLNKQIISYYNFARTGFSTDNIRTAVAATTDACGNPWNRNDTPLNLAVSVIKRAKAAGSAAYFVTDGGVNNTNWTTVVSKLAECQGIGFAANTLLAGVPGVTVNFYYVVPKVLPTDPPLGLQKNIIKMGGACYTVVKLGGPFPQTWWSRVAVPQYNGPGSANPSALSAQIGPDAAAIVNAVLAAGADKVVWLLYYDITPANIDVANLGLATAQAKFPAWAAKFLPATVTPFNVSLIDPLYAGDVRTLVTNLNTTIQNAIPVNAKVTALIPPALTANDLQNTGLGGSPHPNASGHTKLANALSAAYNAL